MRYVTHCPSCGTAFKIVDDQLRIAQGWVRCGHCQAVYKAKETLSIVIDEPDDPAPAATAPAAASTANILAPPPAESGQAAPAGTPVATETPAIAEQTVAAQESAAARTANDATTEATLAPPAPIAAHSMLDRIAAIVANKKNAAEQAAVAAEPDHSPPLGDATPASTGAAAPAQQTVAGEATRPTASPDDIPATSIRPAATETPAVATGAASAETATQANARPMLDWEGMPQPATASTLGSHAASASLPDNAALQWQEGEPFPDPQPLVPAFLRKTDAPVHPAEKSSAPAALEMPALPAPPDIQAAIDTAPAPAAFGQIDDDSAHSPTASNRGAPEATAEDRQTQEKAPSPAAALASASDNAMAEATFDTAHSGRAELQPLAEALQNTASVVAAPNPAGLVKNAKAADTATFAKDAAQEPTQEAETSAEAPAPQAEPDQQAAQQTTTAADTRANSTGAHAGTAALQRKHERREHRRSKSKDGTGSRKHRDKSHDKKPADTRTWWQALLDRFTTTPHHANHGGSAKPPAHPPALPSKPATRHPASTPPAATAATAAVTDSPSWPQAPASGDPIKSEDALSPSQTRDPISATDLAATSAAATAPAADSAALIATEAPAAQNANEETFAFMRDAQRRAFWRRPKVRAALLAGIAAGSLTLAGQWAHRHRSSLAARIPLARSAFQALGWQVPPWQNIQAIEIQDSDFLKNTDDSYQLRVSLRNTSTHPVAMPALELALLDDDEQVVARRVIMSDPALPMPAILPPRGQWDAISEVHVQLPPALAQHGISGYRVAVFYP